MIRASYPVVLAVAVLCAGTVSAAEFVRGDVNQSGALDISDAVRTLLYLFSEDYTALDCADAADANDSGAIDLADAVFCLGYLFAGGPQPPPPFPGCGIDESPDELTCVGFGPCSTQYGEYIHSDKDRDPEPDVDEAQLSELVEGNTVFALDLFQEIKDEAPNLFYSPYSVSSALAMLYAGARGATEKEMAGALQFTLSQESLHPAFNALDLELESRGETAQGRDGEGFRLNIANALWGQHDYTFLPGFLDVLAENYGAGMRLLDFRTSPEPSRATINHWISQQTEERIPELLPPKSITSITTLVLTNTMYFNAAWAFPFPELGTRDGTFTLPDGGSVTVPLMTQEEWFKTGRGAGYTAVEVLYDGRELSMVIVLPDEGQLEAIEESLTPDWFTEMLASLSRQYVQLTMPRFSARLKLNLNAPLVTLGMTSAFTPMAADFSGIDGTCLLYVGTVLHEAFILVDEAGTEAAAATAVIVVPGIPPPPIPIVIDRPFLFFIRDIATEAILFAGRVADPRG